MSQILYLYGIARALDPAVLSGNEAVDGSDRFEVLSEAGLSALVSPVDAARFSQDEIDRQSDDLEWIGAIAWRHQNVLSAVMNATTIIPLRAFTLFSSEETLRSFLRDDQERLSAVLDRIGGCEEWTLRIDLESTTWGEAAARQDPRVLELEAEITSATPGRRFLLVKKLEDEKTRASRESESRMVNAVEDRLRERLQAPMVLENREMKHGSSPQFSLLVERGRGTEIETLRNELEREHKREGLRFVLTGPWPPYSFVEEREA